MGVSNFPEPAKQTARPASGAGIGETDAELWRGELNEPDSLQF